MVQCLQDEALARQAVDPRTSRPSPKSPGPTPSAAYVHVQGESGRVGWYAVGIAERGLVTTLSGTQIDLLIALLTALCERIGLCTEATDGIRRSAFNDGVRAAQREVEALILRLPGNGVLA